MTKAPYRLAIVVNLFRPHAGEKCIIQPAVWLTLWIQSSVSKPYDGILLCTSTAFERQRPQTLFVWVCVCVREKVEQFFFLSSCIYLCVCVFRVSKSYPCRLSNLAAQINIGDPVNFFSHLTNEGNRGGKSKVQNEEWGKKSVAEHKEGTSGSVNRELDPSHRSMGHKSAGACCHHTVLTCEQTFKLWLSFVMHTERTKKWITGITADSKNYKQIITVCLTAGSPYMQKKKKHPDLRISSMDILAALTQTSHPTAFWLLGKADIPVVENSFLGQCVKGTSAALSL